VNPHWQSDKQAFLSRREGIDALTLFAPRQCDLSRSRHESQKEFKN
jgi:hypothetical protein